MTEQRTHWTPQQTVDAMTRLGVELDNLVAALESADDEAVKLRAEYDLAFAKVYLAQEVGSVDSRKQRAVAETYQPRLSADVADARVRHLRRKLDATKLRLDALRSIGAVVRAEAGLAGYQP
ncbi:MAG TPA: hypothetical protein VHA75_06025 [Rugosimonospora sp.]|nr:hypothetical protein [Rugosimonospora sp.]